MYIPKHANTHPLIGGAWYSSNGEFDFEFISALYDTCIRCFKVHKKATAEDVAKFVREGGFFTVTCKTEDIAQILLSMLYDGVIERLSETEAEAFSFSSSSSSSSSSNTSNSHSRIAQKSTCYQLTKAGHPSSSFTSMPCSNCPVADSCFEGSTISPETCEYYTKWLDF